MLYFALIGLSVIIIGLRVTTTHRLKLVVKSNPGTTLRDKSALRVIFKTTDKDKVKDHRVNYTTGRNLCNGRNLVELVAVKCTTPVMEYDV